MSFSAITKRQLGILFITAGILGIVGIVFYDLIRRHEFGGAYQWAIIAGCGVLLLLGALLIPLGDQPA